MMRKVLSIVVTILFSLMLVGCTETINKKYGYTLTKIEDGDCATALEVVYQDDEYEYGFGCLESDRYIITNEDGTEYTVYEVLEDGLLTIEQLYELFDGNMYKVPNETLTKSVQCPDQYVVVYNDPSAGINICKVDNSVLAPEYEVVYENDIKRYSFASTIASKYVIYTGNETYTLAEFFELEILTDSELLLINFESNLVITNLTDSLGGYQIFMQHSGVCDEWDTILGETAEYLILITNRCPVIGGDPYVVIDGVNVEFHDFILNYYVYDENDNDLLEHYGVEYYKNIEAQ